MVLQQALPNHAFPNPAHRPRTASAGGRPDGVRIAGISGTLLFNALLLLVLLIPLRQPVPGTSELPRPSFEWIVPEPLPPLPPPVEASVVPPRPQVAAATPAPPIAPAVAPPSAASVALAEPAPALAAIGPEPVRPAPVAQPSQPPVDAAAVRLEYARAPAPPYPLDALRDGATGTVLLRVVVGTDGRPVAVSIQRSSGDRRLDEAARRQVLRAWRFRAAVKDGRAVEAIGIVPVDFHLDRG